MGRPGREEGREPGRVAGVGLTGQTVLVAIYIQPVQLIHIFRDCKKELENRLYIQSP